MTSFYVWISGIVELSDNITATIAPDYYLALDQFNF